MGVWDRALAGRALENVVVVVAVVVDGDGVLFVDDAGDGVAVAVVAAVAVVVAVVERRNLLLRVSKTQSCRRLLLEGE